MSSNNFFYNQGNNPFPDSRNYNTNTSHPLIQNSQEYIYYKKYVSIHSEDRDSIKYPQSSDFEIELPEDMLNVASLRLYDWCFPCNHDTFSSDLNNVTMSFKINEPYNPNENNVDNLLYQKIFECLFLTSNEDYSITIENGFYNPQQIATELTNKFNETVTNRITQYFSEQINNPNLSTEDVQLYEQALTSFNNSGGYTNFVVVYNLVGIKLWFGNISDGFIITNESTFINNVVNNNIQCPNNATVTSAASTITIPTSAYRLPDFSFWGLPGYLGFGKCNISSTSSSTATNNTNAGIYNSIFVPRFYYGNALNPGDKGYWLLPNPNLTNSQVYWLETPYKINIFGQSQMYMEIDGNNCIDETSPYNLSPFTLTTNQTNGIVNASFAKIPVPTTPLSQWFDKDRAPYKFYYPPAERMRKFHIRLRYHNGELVNFVNFEFNITLEFTLQQPQLLRNYRNTLIYPKAT
jgi:hypothetical protein